MSEKIRKKGWEAVAILLCVAVLVFGVSQKEGFHMDELLSFELANAQFNPWIVPTQPQGRLAKFVENEIQGEGFAQTVGNILETIKDVLKNKGESRLLTYQADVYEEPVWIDAEQFTEYLTVDASDAFQYLSVYFNVKDDNHPPLHFMLLHTVCSLFWGQARPFLGCAINIAAIVGVMILLMKLGRQLALLLGMEEKARLAGIFAALLYGLSAGAMATALLIRMYGLVTFFCVALYYLCMQKWRNRSFERKNFLLIAVTALGFWTQYFFLFYCMILVLVTLCLLLRNKRSREAFCLARSMVTAAAAGLLGFPFAISDVLSSGRGVEALESLGEGFSGYGGRLYAFLGILSDRTFSGFFWVLGTMALMCLIWGFWHGRQAVAEMILLAVPPAGYFLLAARMSPYLVDRYIMPLFPFVMLAGALVTAAWSHRIGKIFGEKPRKWIFPAVCVILLLFQVFRLAEYDGTYQYRGYARQERISREYAQIPCICVYEGVGYYENLPEFTNYSKTLLIKPEELAERKDKTDILTLSQVAVLVKPGVEWEQVREILLESYGFSKEEELLGEGVHGDRIFLLGR